ncbi:AAA family ATPase [Peptoniphilus sp. AGMB00490]|uniref:Nuclease SbcCD subunit C n=1 Tax=Peptoniphilus faecalis TaxID=2731255 RepID=A0A848RK53_9FIRM|nr:AAA family ATPase [Peptoniphilus faecalis]NMW85873.1 AAA family ATPase [Peptoniphilus faecalis]
MIYIKKIELHNFQSHDYTEMEFDRGLNVILGNSDVGKTAILRAIKWALYNEPKGDYFIRQGEKDVSVKITFSNGVIVERSKTPSKNSYFFVDSSGNEMRFEGFGVDVPKEITDATNMYKVPLDNSNNKTILNIAQQLDGPFLLNEQGSLRASAIGRLIGVNYVDDALRTVVRDNKRVNQEIAELIKNRDELKEELEKFNYIKDYKEKFKKITEIRNKIKNLQERLNLSIKLKETLDKNKIELDEITNLVKKFKSLNDLEKIASKLENFIFKKNSFENYLKKIHRTDIEINSINNNLTELQSLDELNLIISKIDDNKKNLEVYENLYIKYFTNIKNIADVNNDLKNYENNVDVQKIIEKLEKNLIFYSKVYTYEDSLNKINLKLDLGNEYIKNFENNDKINFIETNIEDKLNDLKNIIEINNIFKELSAQIVDEENNLKKVYTSIKECSDSYENIILEMGVCPFCYSQIDENSIEHIKYHLRND